MTPSQCGGVDPAGSQSPLRRALEGDVQAGEHAYRLSLQRYLRLARRRAPALPADIQREIPGEMWALVYARGLAALDSAQTSDEAYLAQVHRNAVEAVVANYRPPLTRSRTRRTLEPRPLEAMAKPRRRPYVTLASDDLDLLPASGADVYEAIDQHIDLERHLAGMDQTVVAALNLMVSEGASITAAARATGLTRQTLGRRLRELSAAA